jgi:hypothetical protein
MLTLRTSFLCFVFLFACVTSSMAQQASEMAPPAPVPSQIITAHKVFVSNEGYDSIARAAFERAHQRNRPYNDLYAAMKKWGRYELVSSPADADLVFAIRFTAPIVDCDKLTSYAPQLQLTILGARTHFVLWSMMDPVQGAYRKITWDKNFTEGLDALMGELKTLAGESAAAADRISK